MKRGAALFASLLLVAACSGNNLRTVYLNNSEGMAGTWTVILYGKASYSDPVAVAVLDPEEDGVELVPAAPAALFEKQTGLPASEAFRLAEQFVSTHPDFEAVHMRKVIDASGAVVAIEVRATYDPTLYGRDADPLWVQYWPGQDNRVYFRVSRTDGMGIGSDLNWRYRKD